MSTRQEITLEAIYKKVVDLECNIAQIKKALMEEPELRNDFILRIDKLDEVYDFIRFFRIGAEKEKTNKEKILSFAGCWEDMPDEIYNDFLSEIKHRRKEAFSGRGRDETSIA